ncbi:MAG: hypothetical protein Tsb009_30880 [Planctomycetaceae bacterium]
MRRLPLLHDLLSLRSRGGLMAPTKNRKPQDAPQLLTVAEAARQLSLSRSTLYNLMDQGQLGYAKFGRARRIPQSEVARLIQASLIGGPEQFPAGFAEFSSGRP